MDMISQAKTPARSTEAPEPGPAARAAARAAASGTGMKIHYGRTALALVAVLALLTGVISGGFALAGIGSGAVPLLALLALLAMVCAIVLLRVVAVRSRRRAAEARVEAAFREALSPTQPRGAAGQPHSTGRSGVRQPRFNEPVAHAPAPGQDVSAREVSGREVSGRDTSGQPMRAPRKRETILFDAQAPAAATGSGSKPGTVRTEASKQAEPLTAEKLRTAALAVAAEAGEGAAGRTPAGKGPAPAKKQTPWEPVAVPKPTYVASAKATRPEPKPLQLPAAPKSTMKTSIKAAESAPKAPAPTGDDSDSRGSAESAGTAVKGNAAKTSAAKATSANGSGATGSRTTGSATGSGAASADQGSGSAAKDAKPASGLGNLDDVLQRRRA